MMFMRMPEKLFLVLALSLALIGCNDQTSSVKSDSFAMSEAYLLKNVGGDVVVTNLSGEEVYAETFVSDGSDGLEESQWRVTLSEPQSEDLVVVRVSGGSDKSSRSLSVSGQSQAFAVARASDVNHGIKVNPLSDLIWRISREYLKRSENSDSINYLDYLAGLFIKNDLNGDGAVDYNDVLSFNPNDPRQLDGLNFDFSVICCGVDNYLDLVLSAASNEAIDIKIKNLFGGVISLSQDETISNYSGVTIVGFGAGYVLDENGRKVYGSDDIKNRFYVSKKRPHSFYLTAYPDSGSKILSWKGCDKVSGDKTRCEVNDFLLDRVIEINFGYSEAVISSDYVGLGEGLTGTVSKDRIMVDLPADRTIRNRLVSLTPGAKVSLVVNDKPLLVEVEDVINSNGSVDFGYRQAKLSDIIKNGTGVFSKKFSSDDIDSIDYPSNINSQYSNIKPYKIFVEKSNDASVISLSVEPEAQQSHPDFQADKRWEVDGEAIEISGNIDVRFELDVGASYEFEEGLKFFKVSPSISDEANITLLASGALKTKKDDSGNDVIRIPLGRINFSRTTFLIGFVPVYLNPYVDIYLGANGEVNGKLGFKSYLKSSVFAGVYYSKEQGIETVTGHSNDWSPIKPVVESTARFRMYAGAKPTVQIYDLMGPAIDIEPYYELRSSYDATADCDKSLKYGIYSGFEGVLKWEAKGGKKFFDIVGFKPADLSIKIGSKEGKIFENKVNVCGPPPPAMLLNGEGVSETIEEGSSEDITRTLSIKNVGGQPLTWQSSYQTDNNLRLYPDRGTLDPGDSELVSMTFNNQGSRDIRVYRNLVQISQIGDISPGAAVPFRRVDVKVIPKRLSSPEIVKAFRKMEDPSVAEIEWTVESEDEPFIKRFDAYITKDPVLARQDKNIDQNDAWNKLAEFGRVQRKATISDLPADRVFLSIQAIGTNEQVVQSETLELKGPADHGLIAKTSTESKFLTHDGSWNVENVDSAVFGNIDWKGKYIGEVPTRILSWNGPSSRYFGKEGFSRNIYQGGKLFAVAPGSVHGAAIVDDGVGDEWLVAVVNDSNSDILYVRPNTPSTSSKLYEAGVNPDGWREILSRPQNGDISGGWFFDQSGTSARSVRWVEATITSWGRDYDVYLSVVNNISIKVMAGKAGILGAQINTYTPENSTKSAVLAVDFIKSKAVELKLSTDKWLEVSGESLIPNSELKIICYSSSQVNCDGSPKLAHMTYFGEFGIAAGNYAQDGGNRIVKIHNLDLRSDFLAYSVSHEQASQIEGNYRVRLNDTVVATTSKVSVVGWAPSSCMVSRGFLERVDAFDKHCRMAAFGMKNPTGTWAVGPRGNVLMSQKVSESGTQTLNYISNGGSLSTLLGVGADYGSIVAGVK